MSKIIIFIIAFVFGILGIVDYYIWKPAEAKIIESQTTSTATSQPDLDSKALIENSPKESVKGDITKMSGEVKWESRVATDSAKIEQPRSIQQGEALETGKDGTVFVTFGNNISLSVGTDSAVDFPQTLKDKFVLLQKKGSIIYTNNASSPLSVRSSYLIALLTNGSMEISQDEDAETITVNVTKGTVQIAYNDADFVSQIVKLEKGDTFFFDMQERDGEVL